MPPFFWSSFEAFQDDDHAEGRAGSKRSFYNLIADHLLIELPADHKIAF
jgi:hypothetical protein